MTASDPTRLSQIAWQIKAHHGTRELGPSPVARLRVNDELRLHSEIVRHMAGGVALTRMSDGVIVYFNFRLAQMLGYTPVEIAGQHIALTCTLGGRGDPDLVERIAAGLSEHGVWTDDVEVQRKDGSTLWCHSTISRFEHDEHGQLWLTIYEDITERKRAEDELHAAHAQLQAQIDELHTLHAKLREQALRDPLTQLYNRRYLHENMPREIARAARYRYDMAVLMIDIDHFKLVNDTYGHAAGDVTLQAVAQLIQANLRASDIACRYGGEEILCLMMGTTEESVLRRANTLRTLIADLPIIESHPEARVTVSIGVGVSPASEASMATVIQAADEALYRAKSEGRNCVRLAVLE